MMSLMLLASWSYQISPGGSGRSGGQPAVFSSDLSLDFSSRQQWSLKVRPLDGAVVQSNL